MAHKVCMTNGSHDCNWGWLAREGALFLGIYSEKRHLRDVKGETAFSVGHGVKTRACTCRCFLIGFRLGPTYVLIGF